MSPKSTCTKPGVKGSKSLRATGSSEKETMVVVRPWKLLCATMILALAGRDALTGSPRRARSDGGLHRLGSGVHRQHPVEAHEIAELLAERAHLIVVHGPAGQGQGAELRLRGRDQPRVAVAEVQRRVRTEKSR